MKVRACLVALCLLVLYCSAAYGQTAEWEYKQLVNPPDELLNHYAKNGWEIAVAVGGDDKVKVILKRRVTHPLFGIRTPAPHPPQPPPPPKPTCKLTLAQAPAIRGLRLGMTSDELFALFPANERQEFERAQQLKSAELAPAYGFTSFHFRLSDYAAMERFTGISGLTFGLFDKKVESITAYYWNTPQFDNAGQLMEIITRQFGLPEFKDWPGYNQYSTTHSLACEGFKFELDGLSHNFSIVLTDPTYKKIVEDRKQADLAKKREGFKL